MTRNSLRLKTVLIFLLIFGIFTKYCDSQENRNDAHEAPDGHGKDGSSAFFALRSCHQIMHGDSGEFFSPDYLCSNPPLWCNWTIHVDPGKRVRLYLEDLTPTDACHLKQDQIHVDEPAGYFGVHKVLQKCWHEAKYTSVSNTLYVVLLIGGYPNPPYRGFYGRYQAFGPPIVYNPHDDFTEQGRKLWMLPTTTELPLAERGFHEFAPRVEAEQIVLEHPTPPSPANYDPMYEYYDQPSAVSAELPWEIEEPIETDGTLRFPSVQEEEQGVQVGEDQNQAYSTTGGFENFSDVSHFTVQPAIAVSIHGTSRSGREASQALLEHSDEAVHPHSSHQQHEGPNSKPSLRAQTAIRRNVDKRSQEHFTSPVTQNNDSTQNNSEMVASFNSTEQAEDDENGTRSSKSLDPLLPSPEIPVSVDAEEIVPYPHPNVVEPLSGHRRNGNARNHTELPHLPGDHLFEVGVEVNFPHDPEDHWEHVARSLLLSVKALVSERLDVLHTPKFMSSKRMKRLSTGVLYILWVQTGEGPRGSQVHRAIHAALQGLIETAVGFGGNHRRAVVLSVSTADVNECGTQMVLCDINAACVNRFGSYSCHCPPGFHDVSRLGSGGTLCVDAKASGCKSGPSAELTKGVYVVFFLLSSLVLVLLVAVGVMYHRYHRGAFLVHCHSDSLASGPHISAHDGKNNCSDSQLNPPPPPIRRPKEGWSHPKDCCPAVDLPLLRFSPLLPLDGYIEPEERGKM